MAVNASSTAAKELADAIASGTLRTELDSLLGYTDIDVFQVTLCDSTTGTIINDREHQSIRGDGRPQTPVPVNGGWIDASGEWQLVLRPSDNVIVGNIQSGQEQHDLFLMMVRDTTNAGSLTDAITTTADSKLVTVTHAGHGLVKGDHVTLQGSAPVGGLNCNGNRIIQSAAANSYTFEHEAAATSAVSNSGGLVNWWIGGFVSRQKVPIFVIASKGAPR